MQSGPSSASTIASASTASLPRSSISVIACQRMPCSRIHSNVALSGQ